MFRGPVLERGSNPDDALRTFLVSSALVSSALLAAFAGPSLATGAAEQPGSRPFAALLKQEAENAGLPAAVADAVMAVESSYDPSKIGSVGEIGLMQVRPATAAMLGFRGSPAELADPATNIHYGVTYLAGAWRKAGGDLCRALMKYRAGHGMDVMTPLSVTYCERARAHLGAAGSPLALGPAPGPGALVPGGPASRRAGPRRNPAVGMSSTAFWAAHAARIRLANAAVERRWHRMAAR